MRTCVQIAEKRAVQIFRHDNLVSYVRSCVQISSKPRFYYIHSILPMKLNCLHAYMRTNSSNRKLPLASSNFYWNGTMHTCVQIAEKKAVQISSNQRVPLGQFKLPMTLNNVHAYKRELFIFMGITIGLNTWVQIYYMSRFLWIQSKLPIKLNYLPVYMHTFDRKLFKFWGISVALCTCIQIT